MTSSRMMQSYRALSIWRIPLVLVVTALLLAVPVHLLAKPKAEPLTPGANKALIAIKAAFLTNKAAKVKPFLSKDALEVWGGSLKRMETSRKLQEIGNSLASTPEFTEARVGQKAYWPLVPCKVKGVESYMVLEKAGSTWKVRRIAPVSPKPYEADNTKGYHDFPED